MLFMLTCGAPKNPLPTDTDAGADGGSLQVRGTGQQASGLATADAGLHLTLTTGLHTYTFDVPSEAVTADVTITMEEGVSAELPTAQVVRFSPDGLVFGRAAMLSVDRPYDAVLVGLQFNADQPGADMRFASPRGTGTSIVVAHFSDSVLADATAAAGVLSNQQRANVNRVNSIRGSGAQGLADRYVAIVEPEIERAKFREFELARAVKLLSDWQADVDLSGAGGVIVGNLAGSPTLDELALKARETLTANGLELFNSRTKPACVPGRDVFSLADWASVPLAITADLQQMGVSTPANPLCVTPTLTLTGPSTLAEGDDTVTVTATFELVGPNGEREPGGPSVFNFAEVGATEEPDNNQVPSADGVVTRLFRRPAANRPLSVQITASVLTTNSQLGALPVPEPAVLLVQEPLEFTLKASPTSLVEAGDTSTICATAKGRGVAVRNFETQFTLTGDGALSTGTTSVITTTGEACTTYSAPDPYPKLDKTVTVKADGVVQGAQSTQQLSILLVGSAPYVIRGTPGGVIAMVGGETKQLCVTVTQDLQDVAADLTFKLTGPGSISTTTGKTGGGMGCTTFLAETTKVQTTPLVQTTLTLNGKTRSGPLFSMAVDPKEFRGTLAYSDTVSTTSRNAWSQSLMEYRNRSEGMTNVRLNFVVSAKSTPAGAGTQEATGYFVSSTVSCSGTWESQGHSFFLNDYDFTVTRTGTIGKCTAAFQTQYPVVKALEVKFELTETAVTAGTVGSSGASTGTTMLVQPLKFVFRYTETDTSLVFDKLLTDDDVPPGAPPDSWLQVRHVESVAGSLAQ